MAKCVLFSRATGMSKKLSDNIQPRLVTGKQTAAYLGIGYVKLRHLVRDGVLTPVDIGVDKLLFDRLVVDAIISAVVPR